MPQVNETHRASRDTRAAESGFQRTPSFRTVQRTSTIPDTPTTTFTSVLTYREPEPAPQESSLRSSLTEPHPHPAAGRIIKNKLTPTIPAPPASSVSYAPGLLTPLRSHSPMELDRDGDEDGEGDSSDVAAEAEADEIEGEVASYAHAHTHHPHVHGEEDGEGEKDGDGDMEADLLDAVDAAGKATMNEAGRRKSED